MKFTVKDWVLSPIKTFKRKAAFQRAVELTAKSAQNKAAQLPTKIDDGTRQGASHDRERDRGIRTDWTFGGK